MESILKFQDLSYHYQDGNKQVQVLNKVNYTFEKGKFYAIVGPSGSGKTTALALASGLDVPKSGNIIFQEKEIDRIGLNEYRRTHIAIVFQSYNLISYMTALQNVMAAMEISKTKDKNRKEKALALLNKVGLTEDETMRNVLKLSGGQQQRVAIARAIARDVDLIFADEPTGNLDQDTANEVIKIFKELAQIENKCVVAVTHSQELAQEVDEVIYLKNGKFQ